MARNPSNKQVTHNTQDIGYVLGKMEMLEKQLKEHQHHTDEQMISVLEKLDKLSSTVMFWRQWVFILKTLLFTVPFIIAGNWEEITKLWKDV